MEPTQLGFVIAGSVVAATIAAVAIKQIQIPYVPLEDAYTIRNSKGANVYDPEERVWQFFPNKGGRKSRKKIRR